MKNKKNILMYLELILFVLLILSVIFVDNLYLIVLSFIAFLGSLIFGYNDNDDNSNLNSEDKEKVKVKRVKYTDEDIILETISKHDKNFSKERFLSYSTSIFLDTIKNNSNNDLKKLRMHEDRAMYNKEKEIISDHIAQHNRHIRSMVTIRSNSLSCYETDKDKEYLSVKIKARLLDYVINKEGNVIEGSNTDFVDNFYTLTFVRKCGVVTTDHSLAIDNCPNCGAVVKANSTGVCVYCKTNLINGNVSWVLHEMNED